MERARVDSRVLGDCLLAFRHGERGLDELTAAIVIAEILLSLRAVLKGLLKG